MRVKFMYDPHYSGRQLVGQLRLGPGDTPGLDVWIGSSLTIVSTDFELPSTPPSSAVPTVSMHGLLAVYIPLRDYWHIYIKQYSAYSSRPGGWPLVMTYYADAWRRLNSAALFVRPAGRGDGLKLSVVKRLEELLQ
jgi:hypothetical protein